MRTPNLEGHRKSITCIYVSISLICYEICNVRTLEEVDSSLHIHADNLPPGGAMPGPKIPVYIYIYIYCVSVVNYKKIPQTGDTNYLDRCG
jgi:hypothetical protein